MHWIVLNPPLVLTDEQSPAYPYDGFIPILEKGDTVTAIQDQVAKLGPQFDTSKLTDLHKLLWLINDSPRHKSVQGYVGFMPSPALAQFGFRSDVHIAPFDEKSRGLNFDLVSIQQLSSELLFRLQAVSPSLQADSQWLRLSLTPLLTKIGQRPNLVRGYSLSIRAAAYGKTEDIAVERWVELAGMLAQVFEPRLTSV